jgi:hypothetical protein
MSGSAKYSSVRLSEQRQREFDRQQQEEAERRAQAQKAAMAEKVARDLREAREEYQTKLELFRQQFAAAADSEFAPFFAIDLSSWTEREARIVSQSELTTTQVEMKTHEIQALITDLAAHFETAKIRYQDRRDDSINLTRRTLTEIAVRVSRYADDVQARFDREGYERLDHLRQKCAENLEIGDFLEAEWTADDLSVAWIEHETAFKENQYQFVENQAQARGVLDRIEGRLVALESGPLARWAGEFIDRKRARLGQLRKDWENDEFEPVFEAEVGFEEAFKRALPAAEGREHAFQERLVLAQGIQETLVAWGARVAAPRLADEADPDSAVIFRADFVGDQQLNVALALGGGLTYGIDGFERHHEVNASGEPVAHCASASETIENLHRTLEDLYRFDCDELMWDGKPDDEDRRAEDLPAGTGLKKEKT